MPLTLQCEQHLEDHFKSLRCAEIASSWPSEPTQRANLIDQLYRDVDILQRMVVQAKSHINSLAPISCLPPEILGRVFSCAVELDPPAGASSLGWLRLTHVSRTWRNISLGIPHLWSRFGQQPTCSIPVFLDRAGDHVPLEFDLHPRQCYPVFKGKYPKKDRYLTDALLEHSSRVEVLKLDLLDDEIPAIGRIFWGDYQFDALRRLHLGVSHKYYPLEKHFPTKAHFISLRHLHFQGMFLPFVAPRLTSLTFADAGYCATAKNVYQALGECPLLERLTILNAVLLDRELPVNLPLIRLSHLRHFKIDHSVYDAAVNFFFEHVEVPNMESIYIGDMALHDVDSCPILREAFNASTGNDEDSSLEFSSETMTIRLRIPLHKEQRRHMMLTFVRRLLRSTFYGEISARYLGQFLGRRPAMSLMKYLAICPNPLWSADIWTHVLHAVREVHTLELTSDESHDHPTPINPFLCALGRQCFDMESEDGTGVPTLPLPKLATMILRRNMTSDAVTLPDDLISCLQARADADARPIQTLSIEGFDEDPNAAHALKNLVGSVVWKPI